MNSKLVIAIILTAIMLYYGVFVLKINLVPILLVMVLGALVGLALARLRPKK
ncbi:MAG: hypothetical protein AB1441_01020 [Bacillota bacterium]